MPRLQFDRRELRLTFCTNVLPGTDAAAILANLDRVLPAVRSQALRDLGDPPLGLGLWIPSAAAFALDGDPARAAEFGQALAARRLEPFTLNGFPFGDFHTDRVKEQVYLPTWAQPERLHYTLALGRLLASWLAAGEVGSISTLPLGFKPVDGGTSFLAACANQLLQLVAQWDRLWSETGRQLVLGLEPEPACVLETTSELITFYEQQLLSPAAVRALARLGVNAARAEDVVRAHLGVCFDACHQAVEFEAMEPALDRLDRAGIPLAKLQVSSALDVEAPGDDPDRLERLARFAEPRYLHQVGRQVHAADRSAAAAIATDLGELLARGGPDAAWRAAARWRVHFHVPIHRAEVSGLGTTQAELVRCLRHVLRHDLTRHIEVETYTWGVLPEERIDDAALCAGLAEELVWTRRQIAELQRERANRVRPAYPA